MNNNPKGWKFVIFADDDSQEAYLFKNLGSAKKEAKNWIYDKELMPKVKCVNIVELKTGKTIVLSLDLKVKEVEARE